MKIKKHSFRLLESDEDIEKILGKLDGQKKSNFIREALKYYILHGDRLKSIEDKLKLILEIAEQGQLISDKPKEIPEETMKDNEEQLNDADKFLADSIQNLLNF